MSWVLENLGLILQLSVEHLRQCLIAILLGFVLSIPLGFLAWRFRLLRGAVVTITGLMYTIPSLALLFLLPALFGYVAFSDLNLILALTLYAIALLVRSVVDGLNSVDEGVRGASTAMGFSGARRFFAVELPLAGPVILAGLRVAAVSTIALAPVGILVGVRQSKHKRLHVHVHIPPAVLVGTRWYHRRHLAYELLQGPKLAVAVSEPLSILPG